MLIERKELCDLLELSVERNVRRAFKPVDHALLHCAIHFTPCHLDGIGAKRFEQPQINGPARNAELHAFEVLQLSNRLCAIEDRSVATGTPTQCFDSPRLEYLPPA